MRFFSSIGRAVGRVAGRVVEGVGKLVHSETIQRVGRKIQDACRETAVSTGRQREYDQDTATERETRQIADILSSFSLGLNSQAGSIEVMAQQTVEQYFDNLTAAIQGVMGDNAMVRSLKSQKKIISSNIPGKLRDVLAKRVALTDSECSRILKMPAGTEKEKAMNDFGHKVIQEGLDAIRDVIYFIETYDVTTVRASTPMYLLARVIRSMGIKMVLSGEGADELFGGYWIYHDQYEFSKYFNLVPLTIRRAAGAIAEKLPPFHGRP